MAEKYFLITFSGNGNLKKKLILLLIITQLVGKMSK